jgi:hypothetical protein
MSLELIDSPHITTDTPPWKELATRDSDGLTVSLLWDPATDAVKVAVADSRLDHDFEIHVAGADALAAFHHPFAFAAAWAHLDRAAAVDEREPADLQPQV